MVTIHVRASQGDFVDSAVPDTVPDVVTRRKVITRTDHCVSGAAIVIPVVEGEVVHCRIADILAAAKTHLGVGATDPACLRQRCGEEEQRRDGDGGGLHGAGGKWVCL